MRNAPIRLKPWVLEASVHDRLKAAQRPLDESPTAMSRESSTRAAEKQEQEGEKEQAAAGPGGLDIPIVAVPIARRMEGCVRGPRCSPMLGCFVSGLPLGPDAGLATTCRVGMRPSVRPCRPRRPRRPRCSGRSRGSGRSSSQTTRGGECSPAPPAAPAARGLPCGWVVAGALRRTCPPISSPSVSSRCAFARTANTGPDCTAGWRRRSGPRGMPC